MLTPRYSDWPPALLVFSMPQVYDFLDTPCPFPFPLSSKLLPDPPNPPAHCVLSLVNEWDSALMGDAVSSSAGERRLAPGWSSCLAVCDRQIAAREPGQAVTQLGQPATWMSAIQLIFADIDVPAVWSQPLLQCRFTHLCTHSRPAEWSPVTLYLPFSLNFHSHSEWFHNPSDQRLTDLWAEVHVSGNLIN